VSEAVEDPPGSQAQVSVACPRGTRPFSGGVLSSSESVLVNVNSTIGTTNGWIARENNASPDGTNLNSSTIGVGEWDSFENNATDVNEQLLVRTEIECAGVVT
jgi:hypothetical protein